MPIATAIVAAAGQPKPDTAVAALAPGHVLQTDFTPGAGNALQAAVASSLGLSSLDGVPNFVAAPEGYEVAIAAWSKPRGLRFCKVKLEEGGRLPAGAHATGAHATGAHCIVRGTSPRGDFGHVVVGRVDADGCGLVLVHDPHPDGTMLRPPLVWCAFFSAAEPQCGDNEIERKKRRIGEAAVCVTGANGFIASHVVRLCLQRGDLVHGTVRNAEDAKKTAHLRALPGAQDRLKLFSADLLQGGFDEAISGCERVFHLAAPVQMEKGSDQEDGIVRPVVEGTLKVMRACQKAGVKVVVITSNMSAIDSMPEPEVKSEVQWSDPEGQEERGSLYCAGKTLAEQVAYEFKKKEQAPFRLVSICPTMVLGPMLQPEPNMTMLSLQNWCKNGRATGRCPNDSMSFVDVRDCAAQHLAAMANSEASGRYMSLAGSWHWNDLEVLLKEVYPAMPSSSPCEGTPCKPTQFDGVRQSSLEVELKTVPGIIREAVEELKLKGLL